MGAPPFGDNFCRKTCRKTVAKGRASLFCQGIREIAGGPAGHKHALIEKLFQFALQRAAMDPRQKRFQVLDAERRLPQGQADRRFLAFRQAVFEGEDILANEWLLRHYP